MANKKAKKKKAEQNDPKGAVLKSVKPDLLCGGMHQISVWQPTVIIDSHMHIQSGNCAPLPFLQDRTPVLGTLKFKRANIEKTGERILTVVDNVLMLKSTIGLVKRKVFSAKPNENGEYYRKAGVRQMVPQSQKKTHAVGDDYIAKRNQVLNEFLPKEGLYKDASHLVLSGVIMTMDMEYAHIDGYFGIKVYNAVYSDEGPTAKPLHYWYPKHGFWDKRGDSYVRVDTEQPLLSEKGQTKTDFDKYKKTAKLMGITGIYFNAAGQRKFEHMKAAPCLTPDEETDLYEQWKDQVDYTERVVLKYPLQVLPMFHYDPRRWQTQGKTGNTEPFKKVTGDGLYLGFKMYTAQGYRPWDPRLPIMEEFYGHCCLKNIPILNHCTPDGAPSFDREEYFDFVHPLDTDADKAIKQKNAVATTVDPTSGIRYNYDNPTRKLDYFNEQFVSPDAWRKVLDKTVTIDGKNVRLNKLHICLAHFGGNTPLGRKWNKQIIEMINSGKYPNLYTDISSSFANSDFRSYFKGVVTSNPKIKNRILFGTDWYLTLLDGINYVEYFQKTKAELDSYDTSLWPRFTQYNPYRFYKLDQEIGRIAKNIINKRQTDEKIQQVLKPLLQTAIDEITKEAAYIKVANKGHVNYEETP